MIITKMALPRRTFLRGMGVTLALPLLDAMVPALSALTQTAAKPVRRLGFVYIPNGASMAALAARQARERSTRAVADAGAAGAVHAIRWSCRSASARNRPRRSATATASTRAPAPCG